MPLFLAQEGSLRFKTKGSTKSDFKFVFSCQCQSGGSAHNVAVLSAEVLTKEKSEGCHLPDITLSEC